MMRKVRQLVPLVMSLVLVWPLLGNQSCSEALQEAEQAEPAAAAPNLQEGPKDPAEADQLIKSGGPEVLSPPVDGDQDPYQGDGYDGDDFEESDAEGDVAEEQERSGDAFEDQADEGDRFEHQEEMGDRYEHQEEEGDVSEWGERNAVPDPGAPPPEQAPAPDAF